MSSIKLYYGAYEFKPVPLFSWSTETIRDGKQDALCLKHTLNFTGTLIVPSGNFGSMMTSRSSLENALKTSKQELRLQNGVTNIISGVYPRLINLQFSEGLWVDKIPYTFSFEYEENKYNTPISQYNEVWNYEESQDTTTATVKHDISAIGINTNPSGINNSFVNARTFVLSKKGYASGFAPVFVSPSGTFNSYEQTRTENSDIGTGAFSISENFILSSGNYILTQNGSFSLDEAGIGTVSIDGSVQGLGRGNNGYTNALSAWNASIKKNIPLVASGIYSELGGEGTLYTNHYKSLSVSKNPFAGQLTFNVTYNDSLTTNLPSGIQDFSIQVSDQKPVRVYASFPIMERTLGNVVQDISTSTEGRYTISGTCVGEPDFTYLNILSFVQDKINEKRPLSINYQTLRLDQKEITKDESKRTVNFNLTWIYTIDLSQVASNGFVIIN